MIALLLPALALPAHARDWGVDFESDPTTLTDRDTASSFFGERMYDAGDVDGDGYSDLLTCAGSFTMSAARSRSVHLFFGSGDGLDEDDRLLLDRTEWSTGPDVGCSPLGDIDADGLADVLVADYDDDGVVYVRYGDGSTGMTSGVGEYYDHQDLVPAGDVDGDGLQDVVMATGAHDYYVEDRHIVSVRTAADGYGSTHVKWPLDTAYYQSNIADPVVGAGDLNDDGYDDIIYLNRRDLGGNNDVNTANTIEVLTGTSTGVEFAQSFGTGTGSPGHRVGGGQDFNGDGHPDFVYGMTTVSTIEGGLTQVVYGAGNEDLLDGSTTISSSAWRSTADFSDNVSFAGDVDRDGYADLLVSASLDWLGSSSERGQLFLMYGGPSGVDETQSVTPLADNRGVDSEYDGYYFGEAATGIGDHNGDGVNEIAIDLSLRYERTSAPPHSGIIYIYDGSCEDADGDSVCEYDDCDESDPSIPSETDAWYDGVDSDCDGWSDYDADRDGSDSADHGGDDCDDTDPEIRPDADEIWYDGVDFDCDEWSDYDADQDGFDHDGYSGEDCDDADAAIHPSATEIWYDDVDQDCDGASDHDADQDGFDSDAHGGEDCDDADDAVNPDAADIADDGVDSNCDGEDTESDGVVDTSEPDDEDDDDDDDDDDGKGGCASAPVAPALGITALALLGVARRRR
jgi:hypothetical protein